MSISSLGTGSLACGLTREIFHASSFHSTNFKLRIFDSHYFPILHNPALWNKFSILRYILNYAKQAIIAVLPVNKMEAHSHRKSLPPPSLKVKTLHCIESHTFGYLR